MEKKYVVYKDKEGYMAYVIFDTITMHKTFKDFGTILGAGFCDIENINSTSKNDDSGAVYPRFKCYGKSESLGIASRGDLDADIINKEY